MGRRRNERPPDAPVDANGTAVMEPEANGQAHGPPSPPTPTHDAPAAAAPEPKKNRPVASFAANSDRTTRLEVAVWAHQVKMQGGEEYTQYGLTFKRSWKSNEGAWTESNFHRIHDLPVLHFLVQQAHHWCLLQRTEVKLAEEPLPF